MFLITFLLAAVCSSKHIGNHHHTGEKNQKISGLSDILTKADEDLPLFARLAFTFNDRKFDLHLTHSIERTTNTVDYSRFHYTVNPQHSVVDDESIEKGTVHFVDGKVSDVFEATLTVDGLHYEIFPARHRPSYKLIGEEFKTLGSEMRVGPSRRRLDIAEFTDCWPGMAVTAREVEIGYIVDPDFVERALAKRANDAGTNTEKVTAEVDFINDSMNNVYRSQLGIQMKRMPIWGQLSGPGNTQLFADQFPTAAPGFTLGCTVFGKNPGQPDIVDYLQSLRIWRQTVMPQTYGEWQILTDCFPPPGTIGVAFLGQLCADYGVGVNSWTDETWLTVAHEVGHNIGAEHTFEEGQGQTGGIMDYGDGLLNDQYQFNIKYRYNDICSVLSNTMAGAGSVNNCWSDVGDLAPGESLYHYVINSVDALTDQGATLGPCLPQFSNFRFKSSQYDCEKVTGQAVGASTVEIVADQFCDLTDKPLDLPTHQIYYNEAECQDTLTAGVCGDNILQPGEDCEVSLLPTGSQGCCQNCAWVQSAECSTLYTRVDAAMMDAQQQLYLFQGTQVFRYSSPGTDANGNPISPTLATAPDQGYPRDIATNFPGLANQDDFNQNIDSVVMIPGSTEMWVFHNLQYLRYDMASGTVIATEDLTTAVSQLFQTCGQVEASLGFADQVWLFCQSLVLKMTYGKTVLDLQFVPDYDFDFPASVQTHLDAAVHNQVTGESMFWNGGYHSRWKGRTHIGDVQATLPLAQLNPSTPTPGNPADPNAGTCTEPAGPAGAELAAQNPNVCTELTAILNANGLDCSYEMQDLASLSLAFASISPGVTALDTCPCSCQTYATNCASFCLTCNPSRPNICTSCPGVPSEPLTGGLCLKDNVVAYLGFEINTEQDARYVQGGSAYLQTLQATRYQAGVSSEYGADNHLGLTFDGSEKLDLLPLSDRGITWDANQRLRIEAFFKPDSVTTEEQRFITMKDTAGNDAITISFYKESACEPINDLCPCIEKPDTRYGGSITHPAQCHYGRENTQPYCYVADTCSDPSVIDGMDYELMSEFADQSFLGALVSTGNKIQLCQSANCAASTSNQPDTQQFKLNVKSPSGQFDCFVNAPLQQGQWNKIFFEFADTVFTTGVNGLQHIRAIDPLDGGGVQNNFQIGEWYIGSDGTAESGGVGIKGTVDLFQVSIGEPTDPASLQAVPADDKKNANGGTIAAGILIPLFACIFICLAYYYREELKDLVGWDESTGFSQQKSINSKSPAAPMAPMGQSYGNGYEKSRMPQGQTDNRRMTFDYSKQEHAAPVQWYFANGDSREGPYDDAQFKSMLGNQVQSDTLVWNEHMDDWKQAAEVGDLAANFTGGMGEQADEPYWQYVTSEGNASAETRQSDLLKLNLPFDTYVWREGMGDWQELQNTELKYM